MPVVLGFVLVLCTRLFESPLARYRNCEGMLYVERPRQVSLPACPALALQQPPRLHPAHRRIKQVPVPFPALNITAVNSSPLEVCVKTSSI